MTKLSVIIPIYNAEETLSKAVDSVLCQTEPELELILVDDGSQDDSLSICREYTKKDCRVHVMTQQNSGVSAARNAGIAVASGQYIGFVDADDWIAPEMFHRLLDQAKRTDADVVMCDAVTAFPDGRTQADTITQLSGNSILKKSDFKPSLLLEMAGSAWRCIYRNDRYSDKLRKYPLAFPLGVRFSEDRVFNLYAFGQANQVAYLKEGYYYRFVNRESTVHRYHADYFEAYKKAAEEIEQAIRLVWDDDPELQKAYQTQLVGGALGAICNYYYQTSPLTAAQRRSAVRRVCEDAQLRNALERTNVRGKARWLKDKNIIALISYAKLANTRHNR